MFITNKYLKIYNSLVTIAKSRSIEGYKEHHHIVPKSIGGTDNADNLVWLTAREHFVAHRLLTKITQGKDKSKMVFALWSFTRSSENQKRITLTSKQYETVRKQFSIEISLLRASSPYRPLSEAHKEKLSRISKGIPKSELTKQRMRDSWKFRPQRTVEHCEALRKAAIGRKLSEETKAKMRASHKGKTPAHALAEFTCEHCGKTGVGLGNYKRWHGDNCRAKING